MDVNKLLYALENDDNESIMNLTTKKIMEMNLNILKELQLEKTLTLDYLKKLKGYKYIDEINELKYGSFVRWIPISNPNYLPLHHCGIICEIKIIDDGVENLVLRTTGQWGAYGASGPEESVTLYLTRVGP